MVQCLSYLIYLLHLTPLIMIICFAYSKTMTEFVVMPLCAILRYHNIGYHVYADDTQLYVSLKCKQPLDAISKFNSCLADIRKWMITNELKINDSITEFIAVRSPQLKCELSGLSVNVNESTITHITRCLVLGIALW